MWEEWRRSRTAVAQNSTGASKNQRCGVPMLVAPPTGHGPIWATHPGNQAGKSDATRDIPSTSAMLSGGSASRARVVQPARINQPDQKRRRTAARLAAVDAS